MVMNASRTLTTDIANKGLDAIREEGEANCPPDTVRLKVNEEALFVLFRALYASPVLTSGRKMEIGAVLRWLAMLFNVSPARLKELADAGWSVAVNEDLKPSATRRQHASPAVDQIEASGSPLPPNSSAKDAPAANSDGQAPAPGQD